MNLQRWRVLQQDFTLLATIATAATDQKSEFGYDFLNDLLQRQNQSDAGGLNVGFEWDTKRQVPIPTLAPQNLFGAFLLMLWLNVSAKHERLCRCSNPHCHDYFVTERANKKYCDNICALRVAKRKYWAKDGAAKRRQRAAG